jgi:hypothetical protein
MRHQPIDTKFTHEEVEKEIRYLQLLSKQFPTVQTASTEIINLEAVLQLPTANTKFSAMYYVMAPALSDKRLKMFLKIPFENLSRTSLPH